MLAPGSEPSDTWIRVWSVSNRGALSFASMSSNDTCNTQPAVLSILDIALNTITVYCALVRCAVGATSCAYVEWNKKLSYVPQTDRATRCVS